MIFTDRFYIQTKTSVELNDKLTCVGILRTVLDGVRAVAGGAAARAAERAQHGAQHAPAPVLQRVRRVALLVLAVVFAECTLLEKAVGVRLCCNLECQLTSYSLLFI